MIRDYRGDVRSVPGRELGLEEIERSVCEREREVRSNSGALPTLSRINIYYFS